MILEVAILNVIPEFTKEFEENFEKAQKIISRMKGYISHELKRSMENHNRYILLVKWDCIESHTEGFRKSREYQKWKNLLHKFYDSFPSVEYYESVF